MPGTAAQDGGAAALRAALLDWFHAHGRDLPWRRTRDPYRVLVSEVMLQQTQVARVERAYGAFLECFPTLAALAAAPTAAVLEQWRGLGYNRRAVNLQRTCRAVVERHAGRVPTTLDALLALPGIGPYTARAVSVFAFEQPVAAIDVNVARVLQRAVAGAQVPPQGRQRLGDAVVAERPWATAQALMELGARFCTARRPNCVDCPVRAACAWTRAGAPAPDPAGAPAPRPAQRFTDSDRYHRGRLLDALRVGAVAEGEVMAAARTADASRARRLAEALVSEGLAEWRRGTLTLPERHAEGSP
ncbi:MAG TPA: A/G-specific adenine glycosylase [Euzebyales bacterium]|nr:A/G-specific adenine glycosylase [Euzebyales bacterium]